jgi:hypothetical protein
MNDDVAQKVDRITQKMLRMNRDQRRETIKRMSKEEKKAELKLFADCGGILDLDIDRVMADQAIMGAPDSALDQALLRCSVIAGAALGLGEPVSAREMAETLQKPEVLERHALFAKGGSAALAHFHGRPSVSLRRTLARRPFK